MLVIIIFTLAKSIGENKIMRRIILGILVATIAVGTTSVKKTEVNEGTSATITVVENSTSQKPIHTLTSIIEEAQRTKYCKIFSPNVRQMLAQTLYAEAGCVESDAERSMVLWTILNRYDSGIEWFGGTLEEVISKQGQFAYSPLGEYTDAEVDLVDDVINRYIAEKMGEEHVGRTLPADIYFFHTDFEAAGWHNYFYALSDGLSGDMEIFDRDHPIENPYETPEIASSSYEAISTSA